MLETLLGQVRHRLRLAAMLRAGGVGLVVGLAVLLLATLIAVAGWVTVNWIAIGAVAVACPVIGALAAGTRPHGDTTAARLMDDRFALKDRVITALELSDKDPLKPAQRRDAEQHLDRFDPVECVPLRWDRRILGLAGGLAVATLIVGLSSVINPSTATAKSTLPLANQQALGLQATLLPEMESLTEEIDDPSLRELLEELKEKVDQMKDSPENESDLLATLSEMQQSIAEAQAKMQAEMSDAEAMELAKAIEPADELQKSAKALQEEDYDAAAEAMRAAMPNQLSDSQRRAVSDNLRTMVAASNSPNSPLSKTLGELSEGLDKKNPSQCKQCLSKLAGQCKKKSACKKAGSCLSRCLSLLSECKGQCRGQCESPFAKKTNSPSTKAGSAASNEPLGDRTSRIDTQRTEETITGINSGEGDSETELLTSPEAQQSASRGYSQKYNEFRQAAEEVLENEPLPISHRQTVRQYFEAIRPDAAHSNE